MPRNPVTWQLRNFIYNILYIPSLLKDILLEIQMFNDENVSNRFLGVLLFFCEELFPNQTGWNTQVIAFCFVELSNYSQDVIFNDEVLINNSQ